MQAARRRISKTRRSSNEWIARGVAAALISALGLYSITFSIGQVVAKADPRLAHRLAPYNAHVDALFAKSLSGAAASVVDRRHADLSALAALRRDPTMVVAVSTLGLNAQLRGDTALAQRWFAYSETLSRRDITTQLWLIENAVGRGDIAGALRHYDVALRTSPKAAQVLFPVLTSASADPAIRTALIRTLTARPSWSEGFLNYVADSQAAPGVIAELFLGLRRAGAIVPDNARASLVGKLIAAESLDDAWAYYAEGHPGADRRRSRDPQFTNAETPSLLDWVATTDNSMTVSIQRGASGGVVEFSAPSSVGGVVLEQVQLLPPGSYRIKGHSNGIDQVEASLPYWRLTCRDGREIGRVPVSKSNYAEGIFDGQFTIPIGCPVQNLSLIVRPSESVSGVFGQIDLVQLAPLK